MSTTKVGSESPYMTSKEAAALLRKDDSTIRRRCIQKCYPGSFKDGGTWLIPRLVVERMLSKAAECGGMPY